METFENTSKGPAKSSSIIEFTKKNKSSPSARVLQQILEEFSRQMKDLKLSEEFFEKHLKNAESHLLNKKNGGGPRQNTSEIMADLAFNRYHASQLKALFAQIQRRLLKELLRKINAPAEEELPPINDVVEKINPECVCMIF